MIKDNVPLISAIIDALLFLESAASNEVDPDSAVRCMENIASSILRLDKSDQLALRLNFEKIAEASQDANYANFVRKLPDSIGLATP
ncbi:MAG: hypothetical protein SFU86_19990 [Pirellulaceae bacterium]|nr:hypothetical protein [Pirellulaceae bacterium]